MHGRVPGEVGLYEIVQRVVAKERGDQDEMLIWQNWLQRFGSFHATAERATTPLAPI